MEHRIYSNFDPPEFKRERNNGNRLTVPDLSLSVQDIIEMALSGNTDFPMLMEDDSGEVFDISRSDLTEVLPNADFGFDDDYLEVVTPHEQPVDVTPTEVAPDTPPSAEPDK